jgi:hypothetical protein
MTTSDSPIGSHRQHRLSDQVLANTDQAQFGVDEVEVIMCNSLHLI